MSLDQPPVFVKHQTPTRDAFLDGRLILSQPAGGFRAGLDSVLLGAAVRAGAGSLLDLGAGVGTAALVALAHNPELSATLVESDPQIAAMGAANAAGNGFATRASVVVADVAAPGKARAAAGLLADHFASVIANPPFFDPGAGNSAAKARSVARQMDTANIERWVKTAATHAAPGGEAVVVYPAAGLQVLLAAFEGRFGAITILPLCPRQGEAASRVLVRGIKGSKAPLVLLASRALHLPSGRGFQPEFEAIFRGRAVLDW